jgi:hypothetical protein
MIQGSACAWYDMHLGPSSLLLFVYWMLPIHICSLFCLDSNCATAAPHMVNTACT